MSDFATPEQMYMEALEQLRLLGMSEPTIAAFRKDKTIYKSINPLGLSELSVSELAFVRKWEQESGCLVYHVIHSNSSIGEMLSFCMVSKYLEDWDFARNLISEEQLCVYVENLTYPDCSECGMIGFERRIYAIGIVSLIRTC